MINIDKQRIGIERYRMPALTSHHLRNNKTYITNLDKIGQSLHRTPEQILKYIGFALQTQINLKDISINGVYEQTKLQTIIYNFINCYVLCPVCKNPETSLNKFEPNKFESNKFQLQCNACGKKTQSNIGLDKYNKWLLNNIN